MDSNQTLHDFVLNLITNSEARSAFQLDPEATLAEAGLGDITAADVQDVVPLVVDFTSVQGNAGLTSALGGPELDALDAGPAEVIGQLQAITQQLSVTSPAASIEGNIAAVGTIAADSANLGIAATNLSSVGVAADSSGVSADLSGAQDVAATLDAGVVGPVTAEATGTVDATVGTSVGTADGVVGGALDGTLDVLDGLPGGLTSQLDDPAGLVGSLPDPAGISIPDVDLDDASSAVGGVTGAVDGALDGVGGGGLFASGSASADASADASATGSGDLLDGATDILF